MRPIILILYQEVLGLLKISVNQFFIFGSHQMHRNLVLLRNVMLSCMASVCELWLGFQLRIAFIPNNGLVLLLLQSELILEHWNLIVHLLRWRCLYSLLTVHSFLFWNSAGFVEGPELTRLRSDGFWSQRNVLFVTIWGGVSDLTRWLGVARLLASAGNVRTQISI